MGRKILSLHKKTEPNRDTKEEAHETMDALPPPTTDFLDPGEIENGGSLPYGVEDSLEVNFGRKIQLERVTRLV